jgi:hypothetical protein|tara:strand:+ start:752 stop:898 length:147 start_codon:yes stop_codon:yes gene_type:complete
MPRHQNYEASVGYKDGESRDERQEEQRLQKFVEQEKNQVGNFDEEAAG